MISEKVPCDEHDNLLLAVDFLQHQSKLLHGFELGVHIEEFIDLIQVVFGLAPAANHRAFSESNLKIILFSLQMRKHYPARPLLEVGNL
tara:strand:+ start:1259 stop:1525 length:267 start_codon:yes stop_codon:yes gene_type:complete